MMKPFIVQKLGTRTLTNVDYRGVTTSVLVQTSPVAKRWERSDVISNVGDYKAPNVHRWVITETVEWHGISISKSPTSRATYTVEGVLSKVLVHSLPSPLKFSEVAYNRSLEDFNNTVRGEMDLSVDLLQFRQVMDMINIRNRGIRSMANIVNSWAKKVDALDAHARRRVRYRHNRGRSSRDIRVDDPTSTKWYRKNARKLAVSIASARLEYVYGWLPLKGSIVGLAEEFLNPRDKQGILRVQSIGRDGEDYITRYATSVSNETRVHKVRNKVVIIGDLNPHPNAVLDQASRLSSLNPTSWLWELTPFSFVVDWFVDVGGWIRNAESMFLHGTRWMGGSVTYGYKGTMFGTERTDRPDLSSQGEGSITVRSFHRKILSVYPGPKIPPLKVNLGSERLLNAAALLAVNSRRLDAFVNKYR